MNKKSTFRVLFYLRTNQPNKNGEVMIMARITINSKSTTFCTQICIHPENWNKPFQQAVNSKKRKISTDILVRINRNVDNLKLKIQKIYDKILDEQKYVLPENIKSELFKKEEPPKTVLYYCDEYLKNKEKGIGIKISQKPFSRYILTRKRFVDFIKLNYNKEDMFFHELNPVVIDQLYLYYRKDHKVNHNTALKYMQRFESMLTFAKDMGEKFNDPFINFEYRWEDVERDFLVLEQIEKLMEHTFSTERLTHVRDVFVFSCFTGLAYSDLATLTMEHIQKSFDGSIWLMKNRIKTDNKSRIKLLDIPRSILEKYLGKEIEEEDLINPLAEPILPVISNDKMNEYLNEMTNIYGINKHVTSHLARHKEMSFSL